MIFPELGAALKSLVAGLSGPPEPLSLKSWSYSFDAQSSQIAKDMRMFPQLYSIMGSNRSWSGESISIETALHHSVVWACDRVVSEPVGFLPLTLRQRKGKESQPLPSHPMYAALHDQPNDEITAQRFRATLTSHSLLSGNGYAQIIRRSGTGTAIELRLLTPDQVEPSREKSGERRLTYTVRTTGEPDKTYPVVKDKPQDILHLRGRGWDGAKGYPVIAYATHSIGTALAVERQLAEFYRAGGRMPYLLKLNQKFANDQLFEKFRREWEELYSDPHKVPILEPWLEYHPTGMNMRDSQQSDIRQYSIPEICRWFNVSPHMVGDLSRATFSNIEQLAQSFVTFTLEEWLTSWEQELRRCVLTPQERADGLYFIHNRNALVRGDIATRFAAYATALQNGYKSIDDVRVLEDENPLPDGAGESYHIQLNMATLPGTGQPMPGEVARGLVRLGAQK